MFKEDVNTNWGSYRYGDVFQQTDVDYVIHQTNCMHCMGAGVAAQIARKFPEVVQADNDTQFGDKNMLGKIVAVKVDTGSRLNTIINLYAQFEPGAFSNNEELQERLTALKQCLIRVKAHAMYDGAITDKVIRIGVPWLVGCGISGLPVEGVFKIFESVFSESANKIQIVFVDFNNSLASKVNDDDDDAWW